MSTLDEEARGSVEPTATAVPSKPEFLGFAISTGAIALHVLVDSFVAVEPGASRTDHLPAAAVSVVIAALAVLLYPRLRPGLRATIALVFGSLALVGGALAVADASTAGPGGSNWTGFLLVPCGLVLLGLGAWLLWQSRKPSGRRHLRRALIAIGAAIVAFEVLLPVALALVATQRPRGSIEPVDLGRTAEEVKLRTTDGLELASTYVPSANGAAVILFPEQEKAAAHGRMLARHGYGVLALDMRGYGKSEGDPNAFGWGSTKDIDAAVAFLQDRADIADDRIGGLGLSVGGEQLLEAAAGNSGLRAVVSEGAGERSVRETATRGAAAALVLPQRAVLTGAIAVLSGSAPPPSLEDLVPRIAPRPIFLIHAGNGQGGEDLNVDYYEAAGQPKTLWEIPESSHTDGIEARPQEYEQRVIAFFDEALLG